MELVYLWVDNYKNIKNQGFNFSPRFECEFKAEYDEDKKLKNDCKLKITPKEHIENFFGKDINVTAIVGENGVGKSSIICDIFSSFNSQGCLSNENDNSFILLKDERNGYEIFRDIDIKIKLIENKKEISYEQVTHGQLKMYYFANEIINPFSRQTILVVQDDFDGGKKPETNVTNNYKIEEFNIKFKTILEDNSSFFDFIKEKFIFDSFRYEIYYHKLGYQLASATKLSELINKNQIFNNFDETKESTLYKFFGLILLFNDLPEYKLGMDNAKKKAFEDKQEEILNKFKENFKKNDFGEEDFNSILKYIQNKESKEIFTIKYIQNIIENYSCNSEKQSWNNDNLKSIRNDELNKFENNLLEYLHKNEYLQINFLDKKNPSISLLDLSSGEKVYLEFLTNISYNLKKLNSDKIFLLDEPDLTLHPKWQKKLVSNILKCNDKIKNKKIHFILTTHSPFVLSDIPKENVIFLEKYKKDEEKNQEEGNCKNVTKDIPLETFGANIHTLLSDGFFMSDGLMGEFAKNKINEIKKFYDFNQKFKAKINAKEKIKERVKKYYLNKKENFNNIQSIIGEPFLQTIIKNYLNELEQIFDNEAYKKKKKNELLKQFSHEELEKYLESLKNAKA